MSWVRNGGKPDSNQEAIVTALRKVGVQVTVISKVGHGCPDLAAVWRGRVHLLEVKKPGEKLTPAESEWHARNRSPHIAVVTDPLEAIAAVSR